MPSGGLLGDGQVYGGGFSGGGPGGGGEGGLLGGSGISLQTHNIPIVGPLLFKDPNAEFKKWQMHQSALAQNARRPQMADARMNALRQSTSAMQPVQNMLAGMYGAPAQMNFDQLYENPMPPGVFANPQLQQGANSAGEAQAQDDGGFKGLLGGALIEGIL